MISDIKKDLQAILDMKDIVARNAAIEVIRKILDSKDDPFIYGAEITPEYIKWIQANFYPETVKPEH